GGEPGDVGGAYRREAPVVEIGGPTRVVLEEPIHVLGLEAVSLGVVDHRRALEVVIGDGIDEELQLRHGKVPIACHERHDRGKISTGAVAADRNASRIAADLSDM